MNTTAMGPTVDAEQAYKQFKGLIYRLTHEFINIFGGDFDERLSEAHLHFVQACRTYDPKRGTRLITHLYTRIYYGLFNSLQNSCLRIRYAPRLRHKNLHIRLIPATHRPGIGELLSRLSEEAQTMIRVALCCRRGTHLSKRQRLAKILCEFGWAAEEIVNCFDEIQEAI